MEHLIRNTNNDRIIYTIENVKKENEDTIGKEIKELVDRTITILTGTISSIASACIVSYIKGETQDKIGVIGSCAIVVIFTLFLWYILQKYIVPKFCEIAFKKRYNIEPEEKRVSVRRFNTEILQKVAEITDTIEIVKSTDVAECKTLNFVLSLYKFQEIVNFMYIKFVSEGVQIRRSKDQGTASVLRYSFNIYTVSAALKMVIHVRDEMKSLIKDDEIIKKIDGIELLEEDLDMISEDLDKIKKIL